MTPHSGQETILTAPYRHRVVACGRRFGKTSTGLIAITEAALRGQMTWWLAPTYTMTNQVWRDLKMAAPSLPASAISEGERRIEFTSGGSIAIRSTHSPDTLRGIGLDLAVLDEAAYMEPTVWPNVVRPMLLGRGGRALFLSTPRGHNWFYDVFQLGIDPDEPDWMAFQFQSTANPIVTTDEINAIRRTTPERAFREEYLAEFIGDTGQVFRGIYEAATAPRHAEPRADRLYVAGIDWGRDHDYTAVAVIDTSTGVMVLLDRFRGTSWRLIRERLQAIHQRWRPGIIWAEANSIGAVNIEALQEVGVPVRSFHTTARSKGPLIEGLALAIENREIALLPNPVLMAELAAYGMDRLPSGSYRYSAPTGGHDDTVIATALAWHGVKMGGSRVSFA